MAPTPVLKLKRGPCELHLDTSPQQSPASKHLYTLSSAPELLWQKLVQLAWLVWQSQLAQETQHVLAKQSVPVQQLGAPKIKLAQSVQGTPLTRVVLLARLGRVTLKNLVAAFRAHVAPAGAPSRRPVWRGPCACLSLSSFSG